MEKDKVHSLLFGKKQVVTLDEILKLGTKESLKFRIEERKNKSIKWKDGVLIPFDYGDYVEYINPADNMGWDIIIAPSTETYTNLLICGIVKVSKVAPSIRPPYGNKLGNDKLILGVDGVISENDKLVLKKYFDGIKAFNPPKFFNVLEENWEKETFQKQELGKFRNKHYGGYAVGGVARRYEDAKSFKNNMPHTP